MSGTMPHFASITEKRASGLANRTSAPSAICSPPPRQTPWTAAITGAGMRRQSHAASCAGLHAASAGVRLSSAAPARAALSGPSSANDLTSSPAQNASPAPWSTTARTERSSASVTAVSASAWNIFTSSPLRFFGRFSVTSATPDRAVRIRRWCDGARDGGRRVGRRRNGQPVPPQ